MLRGKKLNKESPVYEKAVEWIRYFPVEVDASRRVELLTVVCEAFGVSEAEVFNQVAPTARTPDAAALVRPVTEDALEAVIPKGTWLEDYVNYTRYTESPLSYHIFSALTVLGASLGRRCYLPFGIRETSNLYPNYCVILVGPPARVMKTTAAGIARSLVHDAALCPIFADKVTPEAVPIALFEKGGVQYFEVPEFSVFFGRQKYNEGLATLFLRLLDCPNEWTTKTVGRGEITVENIALSMLGATTPSLLINAAPNDVTSSGFLSRFVLVFENDTVRHEYWPQRGSAQLGRNLIDGLKYFSMLKGQFTFSPQADEMHREWYVVRKEMMRGITDDTTAEVMARGQVHLLRTAMLVHVSHCRTSTICQDCFHSAIQLMAYIDKHMPHMIGLLRKTVNVQDADMVLETLRRMGGVVDHSRLLRRCSSRIDGTTFKRHINTLKESGLVREEKRGAARFYILQVLAEEK